MVSFSTRIIVVRGADLSKKNHLVSSVQCVFVFMSNDICHFSSRKNGETPKWVVDFLQEKATFRKTIMKFVEDFIEKSYNNDGKPWKSSRILCVKPKTLEIFRDFAFFLVFFIFFISFFFFLHFSFLFFFLFFFFFFHFFCSFFFISHFFFFSLIFLFFFAFFFLFLF